MFRVLESGVIRGMWYMQHGAATLDIYNFNFTFNHLCAKS